MEMQFIHHFERNVVSLFLFDYFNFLCSTYNGTANAAFAHITMIKLQWWGSVIPLWHFTLSSPTLIAVTEMYDLQEKEIRCPQSFAEKCLQTRNNMIVPSVSKQLS